MTNASRYRLLAAIAVVTPLGFATKFYAGPGAHWVESYLGGVLYVVFFILLALVAKPEWPVGRVSAAVLAGTCALEVVQLWHPAWLDSIRATFLGHALLGNDFSLLDFPHYVVGALIGMTIGRWNNVRKAVQDGRGRSETA